MALELKLEFDKTFTNYKDNVTNFKEFMGDDEKPQIIENIESVVDSFFKRITTRLDFLEKTVLE